MDSESLLVALLICLSILPIVAVFGRVKVRRPLVTAALVILWLLFPIALVFTAASHSEPVSQAPPITYRPIEDASDKYVGSQTCRSCHPHNHATWHSSYHRTMTQIATPQAVVGDFDNVTLSKGGVLFRLTRRDNDFYVNMDVPTGPDGSGQSRMLTSQIVLTTGSHHMQAYWFRTQDGTRYLGMLPFVYLIDDQRWIPRDAAFLKPKVDALYDEFGRWNETCIRCHATNGRMRPIGVKDYIVYDTLHVDTRVAEFGIACEACHGPGEDHVRANRDPARRYWQHLGDVRDPTIQNPKYMSHDRSSQVCGQCHVVFKITDDKAWFQWSQDGFPFRPGDDLFESKLRFLVRCDVDPMPAALVKELQEDPEYLNNSFWSDGMVRVSGREYSGLLDTPCYQQGDMSCLTCHQMHQAKTDPRHPKDWANDQLKLGADGNQACLQCHSEYQTQSKLTEHTYHPANSAGSNCYNCHMSYTTYGLLKAIRSHQIDVPSVKTSLTTGRPSACNQCHLDKTLAWSADHLHQWYGQPKPELSTDEQTIAASVLWLLRGDAGQRALMAWSFGWPSAQDASGTDWMAPYLAQLLEDPYDAVRYIAFRSLRKLPGFGQLKYDFLNPQEQGPAARQQAIQLWNKQQESSPPRSAPTVLIGKDGNLQSEHFQRLLKQRNNRLVYLAE